jgi:hypothetical protein
LACLNYVTLVTFLRYFEHLNSNPCVCMDSYTKIHMEIGKFTQHFHMDFALYWIDTVNILLARLNYVSLVIFLRYFDHLNVNPFVWMDWFTKIHVEIGKFLHGFCMILVRHCRYNIGLPKLCYFSYFPNKFWPFKFYSMCVDGLMYQNPYGNRQISTWILHYTV